MKNVQRLGAGPKRKGVMPKRWTLEWFTVVNAGNGEIALHSKPHNRFVRMNNGGFMDSSPPSFFNRMPKMDLGALRSCQCRQRTDCAA
jgi:hypothetical protein